MRGAIKMNGQEYYHLQDELSKLLNVERMNRKFPHGKYRDTYEQAVMDCKSKLHEIYNLKNKGITT